MEVEELIHDEDDQGHIAEHIGAHYHEDREEEDPFKLVQVHVGTQELEGIGGEEGVLESSKPDKEAHEHEDHCPVHLHHHVKCVPAVHHGVHKHGQYACSHGNEAEVELHGEDWRRRDSQESKQNASDGDEPPHKQLLPPVKSVAISGVGGAVSLAFHESGILRVDLAKRNAFAHAHRGAESVAASLLESGDPSRGDVVVDVVVVLPHGPILMVRALCLVGGRRAVIHSVG